MLNSKTKYDCLSEFELIKLNRFLREKQGNLINAHRETGLTTFTIKRAALGMPAKLETLKKIRSILPKYEKVISELDVNE